MVELLLSVLSALLSSSIDARGDLDGDTTTSQFRF